MSKPDHNHIIKKQVLQVEIASTSTSKAAQNELSRIYRHKLQEVIGNILAEYDLGDEVLRFDRLVLTCEYSSVEQLEEAVTKAVKEQLPRLLKNTQKVEEEAPQKVRQDKATVDALRHFLTKGTFPWSASDAKDSLDLWIQQLLKENPRQLLQLLQKLKKQPAVIARLNFQLSAAIKKQLLQLLLKGKEEQVRKKIHFLRNHLKQKGGAKFGVSIFKALEQSILAYALQYGAREFQTDKLVKVFWKLLPQDLPLVKEQILVFFTQGAKPSPQVQEWSEAFQKLNLPKQESQTDKVVAPFSEGFQQLQCYIQKGYWPGSSAEENFNFDAWLIDFCLQNKKTAREQIPKLIAEEKYFQRFIQALSTTNIQLLASELLFKLAPQKIGFQKDLQVVLHHLYQGQHPLKSIHRQLAISLLRYLTIHSTIQLQTKSLLDFLLQEVAHFIPVDLVELKNKIGRAAEELNQQETFKSNFIPLLDAVKAIPEKRKKQVPKYSEQEILLYYLENARFPNGVNAWDQEKLENVFNQFLKQASRSFVKSLRKVLLGRDQLQMLQRGFPLALIQKVSLLFQGPLQEKVRFLKIDLQVIFHQLYRDVHQLSTIAKHLDHSLLRYFIHHSQKQLQTAHLLDFFLQEFARFVPLALEELKEKTQSAARKLAPQQGFKSPIVDLLLALEINNENLSQDSQSDYSDEEVLFHFIETGHFPAGKTTIDLEQLTAVFQSIVENPRPGLVQQLRTLFSTPRHLQRFHQQFPGALVAQVAILFQGLFHHTIQKYQEDLQRIFLENYQGQYDSKTIEQHLNFSLLRYFVEHQATAFQAIPLLDFLLKAFAQFVPIKYDVLISETTSKALELDLKTPFKSPVLALIGHLKKSLGQQAITENPATTEEDILLNFLKEGHLSKENADLEKILTRLLVKEDTFFLKRLREALVTLESRNRLTQYFSSELLVQLSLNLQGKSATNVKNYRNDLLLIFQHISQGQYSELAIRQHLDFAVLRYFLNERPLPFQAKRMIDFLIEEFARFMPPKLAELINQVALRAEKLDREQSFKSPIMELLSIKAKKSQPTLHSAQLFFNFLETGQWSFSDKATKSEAILKALLKNPDQAFIQKISQHFSIPRQFDLFYEQFSEDGVKRISELLQSGHHTNIEAYLEDLQQVLSRIYPQKFNIKNIRQKLDLSVLRYLVKRPQAQLQPIAFLAFLLRDFAQSVPVQYEHLKKLVSAAVNELDKEKSFKSPIQGIVSLLSKKEKSIKPPAEEAAENHFFHFLETGHWQKDFGSSNGNDLNASLEQLLKKPKPDFVKKLQQNLRNANQLERFLQQVSEEWIDKVTILFQGKLQPKVKIYEEDLLQIFQQVYPSRFSAREIRYQVKLSLLRYFVQATSEQLQPLHLLTFLLRNFARFVPVKVEQLKSAVIQEAQELDLKAAFKSPIAGLLSQVQKESESQEVELELVGQEAAIFFSYLKTGLCPKEFSSGQSPNLEDLLTILLQNPKPDFIKKWKQALLVPDQLERFEQEISAGRIAQVAVLFQGGFRLRVKAYQDDLEQIFYRLYQGQLSLQKIQHQVNLSLLRYFSRPSSEQFQALKLITFLVRDFAPYIPVTVGQLIKNIKKAAKELDLTSVFKSPIMGLLSKLQIEREQKEARIDLAEQEESLFFSYLKTGQWPQELVATQQRNLEELLTLILRKPGPDFIQQWRKNWSNTSQLERIQLQLSDSSIQKITQLLAGTFQTKVKAYQEDVQQIFFQLYRQQFGQQVIYRQINLSLLRYFSRPAAQQFRPLQLLLFLLQDFALFVPTTYQALVEIVIDTAKKLDIKGGFKSPIMGVLSKLQKDDSLLDKKQEVANQEEDILFHFLKTGQWLKDFVSTQSNDLLKRVLGKPDPGIIKKLKFSLSKAPQLERFQKQFSKDWVAKVAALLQGREQTKIKTYQADVHRILYRIYQHQFSTKAVEQQINLSLLRYFAAPPKQQFQARHLLTFLLKDFAQFVPVNFKLLQETVEATALNLALEEDFKSPILRLLTASKKQEKKTAGSGILAKNTAAIVLHFLEKGRLPEDSLALSTKEIESIIIELLEKSNPNFIEQMCRTLAKPEAFDRLHSQFSAFLPQQVTKVLKETFSSEIISCQEEIQMIFQNLYAPQYTARAIDRQVNKSMLRLVCNPQKNQNTPQYFTSTILKEFAHFVSINVDKLKTKTLECAQDLKQQNPSKNPLINVLKQLTPQAEQRYNSSTATKPQESASNTKKEITEIEKFDKESKNLSSFSEDTTPLIDALWHFINSDLSSWWLPTDSGLEQVIETLASKHVMTLKQQLILIWEDADYSQKILQSLSPSGIQNLVKAIAGDYHEMVLNYTELVSLYTASVPQSGSQRFAQTRIKLLQIVIQEVLNQAVFLSADFVISCTEKVAALFSIPVQKLAEGLRNKAVALIPQAGAGFQQLSQLLEESTTSFSNKKIETEEGTIEEVEEISFIREDLNLKQSRKRSVAEEFQILRYYLYFGSFRPDYPVYTRTDFEALVLRLMDQYPAAAKKLLKQLFRRQKAIDRLVQQFSDKVIQQFLQLFFSAQQKQIQKDWEVLVWLFKKLLPEKQKGDCLRLLQGQLMRYAAVVKGSQIQVEDYLAKVVAEVAQKGGKSPGLLVKNLREEIEKGALAISPPLRAAIQNWKGTKKEATQEDNIWKKLSDEAIQLDGAVYIHNAGLAIISPYLPRYFKMLDMLEDGVFKDEAAAIRAVHLLQYLITGQSETPEHLLVFNKILCGLPVETPVPLGIELTDLEKETSESMLKAIIQSWDKLNKTTIDGLRGGFLVREAKITETEKYWSIEVSPKAYDVLLETLPWSISIIKHQWIPKRVQVIWK